MQSASQQASILNKKIHRKKKEQESAEAISGLKVIKKTMGPIVYFIESRSVLCVKTYRDILYLACFYLSLMK